MRDNHNKVTSDIVEGLGEQKCTCSLGNIPVLYSVNFMQMARA